MSSAHQRSALMSLIDKSKKVTAKQVTTANTPPTKSGFMELTKGPAKTPRGDRVSDLADRIHSNWRKSVDGILEVAVACAEANSTLSSSEKKDLFELLPSSQSMFSKLASIGADERFKTFQEYTPSQCDGSYGPKQLRDIIALIMFRSATARPIRHSLTRGTLGQ